MPHDTKQETAIHIEGCRMTVARQAEVGQRLLIALAQSGVETDDITITFNVDRATF